MPELTFKTDGTLVRLYAGGNGPVMAGLRDDPSRGEDWCPLVPRFCLAWLSDSRVANETSGTVHAYRVDQGYEEIATERHMR